MFLWKGSLEGHHSARLSWETVILEKRQGGLGVKDLHTWNKACTLRLLWILFFRPDYVWVQWFKEVILNGSLQNYWITKPKQSYSWMVNKLLKLKEVVFPLLKLRLQNGEMARFWSDNWSPYGELRTYLNASNSRMGIPLHAIVSSLCPNGVWSLPPARSEAQLELYVYLTTIQFTTADDYYEWEINGQIYTTFKTGILYDYLSEERQDVLWHAVVWFSRGIPRHAFHTWLVIQNRNPTRDRLLQWGIQGDDRCLLCNAQPQSHDHLFFSCNYNFDLWRQVADMLRLHPHRNWQDTLDQMINLPPPLHQKLLSLLAWQSTMYWIWGERNARLHSRIFRSTDQLFKLLDRQLRNKLQFFRDSNPTRSSMMSQSWF